MDKRILFVLILLVFGSVSALCSEGQININTASAEELDELYGIGPVKAEAIINARPFSSVDDLINVFGIGQITLDKIKEQGLACVEGETGPDPPTNETEIDPPNTDPTEEEEEKEEEEEVEKKVKISGEVIQETNLEKEPLESIRLNSKDIKSEDSPEESEKKDYSKYLLIVFCVLLLFLYVIKPMKRKNEWKE